VTLFPSTATVLEDELVIAAGSVGVKETQNNVNKDIAC